MKRIATIIALTTLSVIMQAQTRGDLFSFVDSYNWKLSSKQFEAKYASRILPKTDSLVASMTFQCPFYVLDDLRVGDYDCVTIALFMEENASPFIYAIIPDRVTEKYMPSILSAKLDSIVSEKMGASISDMDDVDFEQMGFDMLANTKGSFKMWASNELAFITVKAKNEGGLFYALVAREGDSSLLKGTAPIQDTFFGLKMGDKLTSSQIKYAVGSKGTFGKEEREPNTIINAFTDLYFAGSKWDFANFMCTSDGKFYLFNAYDSFGDYGTDNERDAKNQYEGLKEKLDEKYGARDEKKDDDGNFRTVYFGSNGMAVMISNERSRSLGGPYRRYVQIEYINIELYQKQSAANDDEL
ncbi:MAG: hypothetical protein MJY44_03330 [Bacteroidales bacterium]|nr:hypothetical protein [Bacteroidales bacterium]